MSTEGKPFLAHTVDQSRKQELVDKEARDRELNEIHEKCEAEVVEPLVVLPTERSSSSEKLTAATTDEAPPASLELKRPKPFTTMVLATIILGTIISLIIGFAGMETLSNSFGSMPTMSVPWLVATEIPSTVVLCLPFAVIACALVSIGALYLMTQARSRYVDWTDTHLFMEYSGPLTMAIKWTAIRAVQQSSQWDIIGGMKPVLVITTNEGNVFKLKLADITKKNNIGSFFSHVKTSSSNVMIDVDQQFAQDHAYTELWLKYFSAPVSRAKTGLLEPGMVVDDGRYKIVSTISGGGQGTAYLAIVMTESHYLKMNGSSEDENDMTGHLLSLEPEYRPAVGEQVVLKEYVLPVHRGHLTAERTTEQLRSEAEILSSLHHPNIVKIKDAFVEDFRGYLVLEYISGESLKAVVERLGPQSPEAVAEWGIQVCDTLKYLHGQTPPVVHRDVTPDNLMLQDDGTIKLVDFNVACQVDSSSTATVVGKHAYISAEQFRGKPCPQSDIYSLGATLFYLLTAREPEPITSLHPKELAPNVSRELDEIVANCTISALNLRMPNVSRLKNELETSSRTARLN